MKTRPKRKLFDEINEGLDALAAARKGTATKSRRRGARTSVAVKRDSRVEIRSLTPHGLRFLVQGREWLVPFDDYPRFLKGTAEQIFRVELLHGKHLHWPELDIDIELDALAHPEKYPLAYRE